MCLNIDGEVFCQVLREAPLYNGQSLERVEHDLEEGKEPYTLEVEALLAQTCGLSVEEYRRRLVRIRGHNVVMQSSYRFVLSDSGPYFKLGPECKAYVEGEIHEPPPIAHITSEAQGTLEQRLRKERFRRFCMRIDIGIRHDELVAYPERDDWLPRAAQELLTRNQLLTRYARVLFDQNMIPPAEMFFLPGQRERLFSRFRRWFDDRSSHTPPPALQLFLTKQEQEALAGLAATLRALVRAKPRKKRGQRQTPGWRDGWRREVRLQCEQLLVYKQQLKQRYLPVIEQACLNGVLPEGELKRAT